MLASRDGDDSWAAGFGADLLGGILAGLIGSAIVLAAGWWWQRRRNRADFGCLAGTYNVTEKQPSQKPEGTVTINGDGPLLAFVSHRPLREDVGLDGTERQGVAPSRCRTTLRRRVGDASTS
jgi:hypothetical protein